MKYKLEKPIHGEIAQKKYQCTIEWRNGKITADEPESVGGGDTGADPHSLLLSSLAACTLITLRMYIDRKEWQIPQIKINCNLYQYAKEGKTTTVIDRDLAFEGSVTAEQRERLVEVAKACPISKVLENPIEVRTFAYAADVTLGEKIYSNDTLSVVWRKEHCRHSGRCVRQLPGVFDLKASPWINVNGAAPEEIMAQVAKCPTGALSVRKNN